MAIYLVYLLSVALAVSAQKQMFNCEKINSCSCKAPGGTIDLSPLDSWDPNKPKFPDVTGGSTYHYHASYNPCSDYSEDSIDGYCQNIAACMKAMGSLYSMGTQELATFDLDPKTGLEIQYVGQAKIDNMIRTAHVSLHCDPNVEGQLTAPVGNKDGPDGSLHFYMILTSKYCCPRFHPTSPPTTPGTTPPGTTHVQPAPARTTDIDPFPRPPARQRIVTIVNVAIILCVVLVLLIPLCLVGGNLYGRYQRRPMEKVPETTKGVRGDSEFHGITGKQRF